MTVYFEFEDVGSINTNLGSVNYGLALIKAGMPVATLSLGATSSYSYKVFTGKCCCWTSKEQGIKAGHGGGFTSIATISAIQALLSHQITPLSFSNALPRPLECNG